MDTEIHAQQEGEWIQGCLGYKRISGFRVNKVASPGEESSWSQESMHNGSYPYQNVCAVPPAPKLHQINAFKETSLCRQVTIPCIFNTLWIKTALALHLHQRNSRPHHLHSNVPSQVNHGGWCGKRTDMMTALLVIFDRLMYKQLYLSQTSLVARFFCISSRNSSFLYGELGHTAKPQVSTWVQEIFLTS